MKSTSVLWKGIWTVSSSIVDRLTSEHGSTWREQLALKDRENKRLREECEQLHAMAQDTSGVSAQADHAM